MRCCATAARCARWRAASRRAFTSARSPGSSATRPTRSPRGESAIALTPHASAELARAGRCMRRERRLRRRAAGGASRTRACVPPRPRATARCSSRCRRASGDAVDDAALARAIASDSQWPPGLLAAIVGAAVLADDAACALSEIDARVFSRAASRGPVTAATGDALRVVALALAARGRRVPRPQAFAERYLQSCQALHRAGDAARCGPLRTAGASLRVGLYWSTAMQLSFAKRLSPAIAHRLGDALPVHGVRRPACRCDAAPLSPTLDLRVLPADADTAARGIAMLDLDVLIDVAGLRRDRAARCSRGNRRASAGRFGKTMACPSATQFYDRTFDATARAARRRWATRSATRNPRIANDARRRRAANWRRCGSDAVLAHQRGEPTAARAGYASVLAAQPDSVPALYLPALFARADGDTDIAARTVSRGGAACARVRRCACGAVTRSRRCAAMPTLQRCRSRAKGWRRRPIRDAVARARRGGAEARRCAKPRPRRSSRRCSATPRTARRTTTTASRCR